MHNHILILTHGVYACEFAYSYLFVLSKSMLIIISWLLVDAETFSHLTCTITAEFCLFVSVFILKKMSFCGLFCVMHFALLYFWLVILLFKTAPIPLPPLFFCCFDKTLWPKTQLRVGKVLFQLAPYKLHHWGTSEQELKSELWRKTGFFTGLCLASFLKAEDHLPTVAWASHMN